MIDGFVKSPYAALRPKTGQARRPAPTSNYYSRLVSGAFYEPVSYSLNFERTNKRSFIACASGIVIPAKAGIQSSLRMDARLRTSGMTDKRGNAVTIIMKDCHD